MSRFVRFAKSALAARKAVRPDEAAKILGISRAMGYQLARDGRLRSVRVGRAVLIPIEAIDEFLAGKAA